MSTDTELSDYQKLQEVYLKWHDGRRPLSGFIKDIQAVTSRTVSERMLAIIGEDYKPSDLENDKRWTRFIPPSSECYVTQQEALAANYEFAELRAQVVGGQSGQLATPVDAQAQGHEADKRGETAHPEERI